MNEPQTKCEHKYVFLETRKWMASDGGYHTHFIRIDRFFCERCLEKRDIKQDEYSRETPEWY